MTLEPSIYHVTTADGKYNIGREIYEDRSLNPKMIVAYAGEGRQPDKWEIYPMPGDKYDVKIRGNPISTENDKLSAHLYGNPQLGWTITPCGQDLYLFMQDGKYIEVPTQETHQLKFTQIKPSQGFKLVNINAG